MQVIRAGKKDSSHVVEVNVGGREGGLCPKMMMENILGCVGSFSKLDPTYFRVSYCRYSAYQYDRKKERDTYSGALHSFIAILILWCC